MATVTRALRPLRRELDNTRTAKPSIRSEFKNSGERDAYLNTLQQYLDLLTMQKTSFEKVRKQYLSLEWTTEADRKAAEEQAEEDSKLLAAVDKVLVEVNFNLRQVTKEDKASPAAATTSSISSAPIAATKLPKLTFPTFNGNILMWQNFWDRFNVSVHENSRLSNVDKMTFLMGQLTGEAASTISGLTISEANYSAAVAMLKERYGDAKFIIDSHYTALSEIQRAEKQKDLRMVVDKLEQHLNALEALKEDVNHRQFSTMIRSKLPPPTLMQMEKEEKEDSKSWDVNTLRQHLRSHLQIYERSYQKLSQSNEEDAKSTGFTGNYSSNFKKGKSNPLSTTSALLNPQNNKGQQPRYKVSHGQQPRKVQEDKQCPYCDQKGHYPDQCAVFPTSSARQQKLKEKGLCLNCLRPFHPKSQCPRLKPCFTCKRVKNHHSSLCRIKYPDKNHSMTMMATHQQVTTSESNSGLTDSKGEPQLLASNQNSLLQTAIATFLSQDGKTTIKARGIFDNGSQRSFITEQLAQQLKLHPKSDGKLSIITFGSAPPKEIDTKVTKTTIQLRDGNQFTFTVNVIPIISGNLQMTPINSKKFKGLFRDIPLADQIPAEPESITVNFLIGADFMWDLLTGEKISISNELYLIGSKIGWLLGGRSSNVDTNSSIPAMLSAAALYANASSEEAIQASKGKGPTSRPIDLTFMWDLETLGIKDRPEDPGNEEALQKFNETVTFQDNRYHVTWPWREEEVNLPSNYHLALGRLNSLLKKYKSEPQIFEQYQKVIEDQLQKGIIEKVNNVKPYVHRQHYMPHHAVITPGKSTKLRVVYDASAKTNMDNKSLNDCLYRGPVILDDIVAILTRFRLNKIAIAADIEKAFLQVGLQESERDVTRFLWLRDPTTYSTENNIQIYRFTRVPFGITSSPFLLAATIQYHLRKHGSETAMNILRNIYVDNILTGVDTTGQALNFYTETKQLFKAASMNVREWITNSEELSNAIPAEDRASGKFKVLGIPWNPITDTFSMVTPESFDFTKGITKRSILQFIASFFDPMGLLSPAILCGKILLQQLWKEKFDWDTPITGHNEQLLKEIADDLCSLSKFTIPRFLGNGEAYELHAFCDASQTAYGVSVYLRIITKTTAKSHLVFAKARLAPVRATMTIPRLELMAVHVGAKCLAFIANALPFKINHQIVWTDSQCVLHWLQSEKPLTVFVRNRINQIKENEKLKFRYICTDQNPADLASRGLSAQELIKSALWWYGPKFLCDPATKDWSKLIETRQSTSDDFKVISEVCEPTMTNIALNHQLEGVGGIINRHKFSSLTKLLRVTAWCLRIGSRSKPASRELTAEEIQSAKTMWIRWIQENCISVVFEAIRSKKRHQLISELSLWVDESGLLRCGGRLQNAELPDLTIHPILLPRRDHFTTLIIQHYHQLLYHAGVSHTLAQIRNEFWIPAGRAAVYKVVRSCLRCRKYDGYPYKVPPVPALPGLRVNPSVPFTFIGLDYLGPLYIKDGQFATEPKKVWVCLFTCLAIRAIHLEMVHDLSAEQFLQCLQRFCARRGIPSIIYSDNAPHFKLVNTAIDKLWSQVIHAQTVNSYITNHGIQWRFITERAPWMGGFYERLVRSVKQGLRKSLGRLCLTVTQLQTILTEIEAVINSRPLVYVGSDFKSGYCLTPSHFMSPNTKMGMPSLPKEISEDTDYVTRLSSKDQILATWNKGQAHLEQFWKLWKNDYLLSLRERSHCAVNSPRSQATNPPTVGDIVQIQNDGPRGTWQLGQVTELIPSSDGAIRSVKLRLATGKRLNRSVMHVYPLECPEETSRETEISPKPPEKTHSRPQRKAAQAALKRIRKMAHDSSFEENSDNEEVTSSLLSSTNSTYKGLTPKPQLTSNSYIYTIFLLLLLTSVQGVYSLRPLICQSHEAKLVFDLSRTTVCSTTIPEQPIHEFSIGIIKMFKRNIAKYGSAAFRCRKIKITKSAWTGFAKAGWDHSVTENEVAVTEQECRSMIESHRCAEGPLLGSESIAFTDNKVDFPYTTGNAWDCCKWYSKEVTNCFITKGKVYETFGGVMESNLGNTANCEYSQKSCILPDTSVIIWETVKEAKCEFVDWRQTSGKFWNGRFLSEDQEIALTWNPEKAPEIELCDKRKAKMTDQGIPIIYVPQRGKRGVPSSNREISQKNQEATDLTAVRLQALEERINQAFAASLNSDFNRVCQSLQRMQQIDLILAHSEPTLVARHTLNESQIMARLNGHLLEVWPCVQVESYSIKPMIPPRCSEWIPINFTAQGESIPGFLDPKTNIVFKNSAPADCKLVEEVHLLDEQGGYLVYSAREGTIKPFTGTIIPHPLYHDNLTTIIKFNEVIHKPLSMYSLGELRAQISLNDLYDSVDKTQQILDKLADISDSQPSNSIATKIMENLQRYTPWGLISSFLNHMLQVWIYACCAYITVSLIWKQIIWRFRLLLLKLVPRYRAEKVKVDPQLLTNIHGSVEKTVESNTLF